jgi:hypothetical protein
MDRTIICNYTNGHALKKVTRACYAATAVPNAIMHMQMDDYTATCCEVWDEVNGELHAVIKRNVKGNISIVFSRIPMRGV